METLGYVQASLRTLMASFRIGKHSSHPNAFVLAEVTRLSGTYDENPRIASAEEIILARQPWMLLTVSIILS